MLKNAYSGLFQIGYVTPDVEKAAVCLREWYGIEKLYISDSSFEVTSADGETRAVNLRLGFAYVDDMMLEVIQPVSGAIDIYTERLKASRAAIEVHHFASRITGTLSDWDAFRATIAASGREVAIEGAVSDGLRFIYVDDRARLGHYMEYMWLSDPFFAWFTKNMPRY